MTRASIDLYFNLIYLFIPLRRVLIILSILRILVNFNSIYSTYFTRVTRASVDSYFNLIYLLRFAAFYLFYLFYSL